MIGNDVTVTMAAEAGQLELNAFEPVIFDSLCQGMAQLTNGLRTLTDHCVSGIVANVALCREEINRSVGIVTALCPLIGYDAACSLAKESLAHARARWAVGGGARAAYRRAGGGGAGSHADDDHPRK